MAGELGNVGNSVTKRRVHEVVNTAGGTEIVHFETDAGIVIIEDKAGNYEAKTVEDALAEVMEVAKTGGVTGVKGDSETEYRKGNVNITKANIGLGNVDNTADANKSVKYAGEAGKVTNTFSVLGQDNTGVEKSVTFDGSGNKELVFNEDDFDTTLNGNTLEVTIVDKGYAAKSYVDTQDDKKLDKVGGTITGNLAVNGGVTIGGNLTVNGTTTTVDSTTLQVKDKLIEVAHGNTTKLTTPAGIVAPKYDGTNSGALVFDGDGVASVGDVVLDSSGNIDTTQSNLQPLATRTGLVGGNLVEYDSTNLTLVDSGKKVEDLALKTDIPTDYVTIGTTQTVTGEKTFNNTNGIRVNRIHTISGTAILDFDGTNLRLGQTTIPLHLRGSKTRPQYTTDGSTFKDLALVEDIASTKVNNAVHADSADNATTANKVANKLTISGNSGSGATTTEYDGSGAKTVTLNTSDFTSSGGDNCSVALKNTGVNAGQYSAVNVDSKGRVTAGGKSIEWGTSGQTTPSGDLMIGGLFMELI